MVSLLIGSKGTGKTKRLLSRINAALEVTKGYVIVVEKDNLLTYNVNYRARHVSTDYYNISGYDGLFGLLSGLLAGNHDITDVFIDATLRIGGRDFGLLSGFLSKINTLSELSGASFTFTVSTEEENIPDGVFDFCKKA